MPEVKPWKCAKCPQDDFRFSLPNSFLCAHCYNEALGFSTEWLTPKDYYTNPEKYEAMFADQRNQIFAKGFKVE